MQQYYVGVGKQKQRGQMERGGRTLASVGRRCILYNNGPRYSPLSPTLTKPLRIIIS